jgi:hypothetical protein
MLFRKTVYQNLHCTCTIRKTVCSEMYNRGLQSALLILLLRGLESPLLIKP